jgi:hypothetical protein
MSEESDANNSEKNGFLNVSDAHKADTRMSKVSDANNSDKN